VIAGLLWGAGARLAMRVVALMGRRSIEFSLSGTMLILLVGAYAGIPLGLIYLALRRRLPAARVPGAVSFGVLVLLALGYPFLVGPLRQEAVPGQQALAIAIFAALFVLLGVALALAHGFLDRVVPRPRQPWAMPISLAVLAVPATLVVVMVVGIVAERLGAS
jgi:hypothetical protein